MENLFEVTSKINNESKMHLEECLQTESSNDDIMVEAEQKLHSIQEEAKRLTIKRDEIAKVYLRQLIFLFFFNVISCTMKISTSIFNSLCLLA